MKAQPHEVDWSVLCAVCTAACAGRVMHALDSQDGKACGMAQASSGKPRELDMSDRAVN